MPRRPVVRLLAVGSSSLPLLMAVQSALAQQYTLQHTSVVNLTGTFFTGSANGVEPISVAFDGTNAYVGGFDNSGSDASVGVVRIDNALSAAPTINPLGSTQFVANAQRGLVSLAYIPANATNPTAGVYGFYASNGASTDTVTKWDPSSGTQIWQTVNPFSNGSIRGMAMGVDPISGPGGTPELAFVANGQGRRASMDPSTGALDYTFGNGLNPGGIMLGEGATPNDSLGNFGNLWRAVSFDSAGNIVVAAENNFPATLTGIHFGLRNSVNQWRTLAGTTDRTSGILSQSPTAQDNGRGVALLEGLGASELLAFVAKGAGTITLTDVTGATRDVSASAIQLSKTDGTTTGLAQTALLGGEDGLGVAFTGTRRNFYVGKDANGNPVLAVVSADEKRLDTYSIEPTWNAIGGGTWSTSGNWLLGLVPSTSTDNARFGSSITAAASITVDGPKTVKDIKFDSAFKYTVGGTGTVTLDSPGNPHMDVVSGSHEIAAPLVFNKNTVADIAPNSTLTISGPYSTATSSIALVKNNGGMLAMKNLRFGDVYINGGTISIMPNGTSAGLSVVTGLHPAGSTDNWTASVDINNNPVLLDYDINTTVVSPIVDVANQIKQGYNGGSWTGNGITSSAASAVAADVNNAHKTAVGYAEASTTNTTSFFGHAVDSDAVLIRYTYSGDANCDGIVNALDFNAVASNFGQGGLLWQNGDFNFDGTVDTSDFVALASNFNLSMPSTGPGLGSLVPEPSMLFLAAISAALLANRRRRT